MKTTLNQIKSLEPGTEFWKRLLRSLGKTKADDEPLNIITVLDSNGLDDAIWCLLAVVNHDKENRLYAVWCARQVKHLMNDPRSIDALDVAERFANGQATQEQLTATGASARAAARDAARAAWYAAGIVSWDAALNTAGTAAAEGIPAWAAARDAALAAQEKQLRKVCAEIEILEAETA